MISLEVACKNARYFICNTLSSIHLLSIQIIIPNILILKLYFLQKILINDIYKNKELE